MIGRKIAVLALTGAIMAAPVAAHAEIVDPKYPAPTPPEANLEGSLLEPFCSDDAPYLAYDIIVNDPGETVDPSITTATITFVNPGGENWSTEVPIGSGSILWPGASVSGGVATGWPGYQLNSSTGEYEPVGNANFGWSRAAGTEVVVEVNPSMSFAVSYPPSTAECMTTPVVEVDPISKTTDAVPTLSTTGFESMPMALGAGALLLAGAATVVVAARRTSAGTRS